MGSTFSRTRQSQSQDAGEIDAATTAEQQRQQLQQDESLPDANIEGDGQLKDSKDRPPSSEHAELPADMALILESGVYKDLDGHPADVATANASKPGQSIQDAVRDLKEKYKINAAFSANGDREEGELQDIRAELARREDSLKAALAAARAKRASARPHCAAPATQMDADNSSSDESDSSSSSAASSSSSGSSLGFGKQPVSKKRKAVNQDPDSGEDEEEIGSDDEDFGGKKGKKGDLSSAAAQFASKNEIVDPSIPKLQIDQLPASEEIRSFGIIESIINNVVVIRADIRSGEQLEGQVLDEGSLVCLEDKRVLGPIFETFGAITCPLYSIRLPNDHPLLAPSSASTDDAQQPAGSPTPLKTGLTAYFPTNPSFSSLLFTQQIKLSQLKGSDASNLYDEEPADNEVEFSDDEQEQEYRRLLKQRRKMRANGTTEAESSFGDAEYMFDGEDDESLLDAPIEAGLEDEDSFERAIDTHHPVTDGMSAPRSPERPRNSTAGSTQPPSRGSATSRGQRPARGQAQRGRGASRGAPRGRGSEVGRRGGSSSAGRGSGRGRGRGGARSGYEPPQSYHSRTASGHSLPPRPAFQHPDALPYDEPISAPQPYARETSSNHQRSPSSSLPPRPQRVDDGYDPMSPASASGLMQSQQAWSPYSNQPPTHTPYGSGFPPLQAQAAYNNAMNFHNPATYSPYQNNMLHAMPGYNPGQGSFVQQGASQSSRSHNPHEYQVRRQY